MPGKNTINRLPINKKKVNEKEGELKGRIAEPKPPTEGELAELRKASQERDKVITDAQRMAEAKRIESEKVTERKKNVDAINVTLVEAEHKRDEDVAYRQKINDAIYELTEPPHRIVDGKKIYPDDYKPEGNADRIALMKYVRMVHYDKHVCDILIKPGASKIRNQITDDLGFAAIALLEKLFNYQ